MQKLFPFRRMVRNCLKKESAVLYVQFSAASDVGLVRKTNQDNLYVMKPVLFHEELAHFIAHGKTELPLLFAVCDGMGGGRYGEKASFEAVKMLEQVDIRKLPEKTDEQIEDFFRKLYQQMNDTVFRICGNSEALVGCTATLLYIDQKRIYLVNAGDSPGMCYIGNKLTVMTQSDNRANQMYLMGRISEKERWTHATKNQLTQYLGMNPEEVRLSPHICRLDYPSEPMICLICSDGLLDKNNFEDLEELFQENEIQSLAEASVRQAMDAGSRDNITAIAVQIGVKEI